GTVTSGTPFNFTVTALDASGNRVTSYRGRVHFTSTQSAPVLPADYTFTGADQRRHPFSATFYHATTSTLTATDPVTPSTTGKVSTSVAAGAATKIIVSGPPASRGAGTAFSVTITLMDAYGNTAVGYRGTIVFSSSDGHALLPADYTFT